MEKIATFLNQFEVLSKENANKFAGLQLDDVRKLYQITYEESFVLNSEWIQLAKRKYGSKIFKRYRIRGSHGTINYCKLQPKDPTHWKYLWSPYRNEVRGCYVATGDALDSVNKEEITGNIANSAYGESPFSQERPQVQQRSLTSDSLSSINQRVIARSGQIEDSAYSELLTTTGDPLDSCVLSEYTQCDSVNQKVIETIHLASKKSTIEPSSKQKRLLDHYDDEDQDDNDEVYPEPEVEKGTGKRAKTAPYSTHLPDLDSEEMREYAKRQLKTAPSWIQNWLKAKGFATGLHLDGYEPHFITAAIRKELKENGFAVIKGVFDIVVLNEARRYIEIKQKSEQINESSYEKLCRKNFAVGLVTKNGWTKTDYAGYAQQVVTASPNLYKCVSELYGTTRLLPNFYEYKYNYGRSDNNGNEPEFTHSDVNYPQLLFAEQAGLQIDDMYQFITPFTPMSPESTTVYVAKGFNQHWKEATYRAMKAGHWSRCGWQACNPLHQFLPEDVQNLIKPTLTPLKADPGDFIIFSATLPHGPNLNSTGAIRIAAYPYLAPYLIGREALNDRSYLPNGVDSVLNSVRLGVCPKYSAHAACKYELKLFSRHFFPLLPYRELWRSLLADCLFGFKSWQAFERSEFAKLLFAPPSPEQSAYIGCVHDHMASDLQYWNDEMEALLTDHEDHSIQDPRCALCNRLAQATLEQWWHSTEAVYHRLEACHCHRCDAVKQLGWKHWQETGGCTCPVCVNDNKV